MCLYVREKTGAREEEMVEEGPEWKENGESKEKVLWGEKEYKKITGQKKNGNKRKIWGVIW